MSSLLAAALLCWTFAPAPHGARPAFEVRGGREERAVLLARDARLGFTPESAARARAALEAGGLDAVGRAAALLALGAGRALQDLARLESALADGAPEERRAAWFALGEAGAVGWPALASAWERAAGELGEEHVEERVLALLVAERAGAGEARARLTRLAEQEGPLGAAALRALASGWSSADKAAPPLAALEEYLELRWRAARAYGFVDGQRGPKALASELFADPAFRARVVHRAAAGLPAPALEVHLTELLELGEDGAEGGAAENDDVLSVAAVAFPTALARAHADGTWRPSLAAWQVVLEALEAARAERRAQPLLEAAFRAASELEPHAGRLLVRAGGDLPWTWVLEALERGTPAERVALIEACGERGEKANVPELTELLTRRPELGLAPVGLVALARLAHPPAKEELETLVRGPARPERAAALRMLARVLYDPRLRPRAEEALRKGDLEPELRLALELGLALGGAARERGFLRAALAARPAGETRLALARALATEPTPDDLDALAALFPVEGDTELTHELAVALLAHRHPALKPLLCASLWGDPWNTSVLAGGLLARAGPAALLDELAAPPRAASEADLRRVGFALGEWGGLAAFEALARTRSEGDPAFQGALLGALFDRAVQPVTAATIRLPVSRAPKGSSEAPSRPAPGKRKGPKKGPRSPR
jgi:hypothetical protein